MNTRSVSRFLIHRIGRRGATLLFFAILDFGLALSLYEPADGSKSPPIVDALKFIASIAPLAFWGTLWLLTGIACLVGAFMKRDQFSFMCAVGIKMLWGLLYFLMAVIPHVDRAWLGAVIWICLGIFVFIISTWPETPETLVIRHGTDVYHQSPLDC